MNKNTFLIALSIAFFMFSCSQDLDLVVDNDLSTDVSSIELAVPITRIVAEEEAEAFANMAVRAILNHQESPGTRSAASRATSRVIGEIVPIQTEDGITVMHAINFKDDLGFMILTADKESPSFMLQFSDTLNFNPAVLTEDSPMGMWIREQKEMIAEEIKKGITDETIESYQLWENIAGQNEGMEIEVQLVNFADVLDDRLTTRARRRTSRRIPNRAPSYWISEFRWGQGRGYNENAPRPGVYPVGAPVVAIGLICNHWMVPFRYNYWAMPTRVTVRTPNAVSMMFRDIADNIPGYWWGTGTGTSPISGAFPHEITAGLRNLGYGDAWHRSFDFELALSNITHGRPILLQGDAQSLRHVWVADGYWEQIWLVERRFLGITINSWFEYADMIFMNWGWEGLHNGWVNPTIWRNENTGMPHFFTVNRLMWTNIYPTGTFQ